MFLRYLRTSLVLYEEVELIKRMNTWRPILLLVLNFVVGWLVSHGVVDQTQHSDIVTMLADVVGYGIIFFTSIATVWHALKHPLHAQPVPQVPTLPQVPEQTAFPTTVKTEVKTEQIFTPSPQNNPGTPDM